MGVVHIYTEQVKNYVTLFYHNFSLFSNIFETFSLLLNRSNEIFCETLRTISFLFRIFPHPGELRLDGSYVFSAMNNSQFALAIELFKYAWGNPPSSPFHDVISQIKSEESWDKNKRLSPALWAVSSIGWVADSDQRGTWFESHSLHLTNL